METPFPKTDHGLESLRRKRAELRDSMTALEHALASPATGSPDVWADSVQVSLVELSADFGEHIGITEGTGGLYVGVLETAPRLASAVEGLTREHVQIKGLVEQLLTCLSDPAVKDDVDGARVQGTTLLSKLSRHRQRGADLVYEAYQTDIGGET
jgi:hypothetical protein